MAYIFPSVINSLALGWTTAPYIVVVTHILKNACPLVFIEVATRSELASLLWQKYDVPLQGYLPPGSLPKAANYGCTVWTLQNDPSPRGEWKVIEIHPTLCLWSHASNVRAVSSKRSCPWKFHSRVPSTHQALLIPLGMCDLLSFIQTSDRPMTALWRFIMSWLDTTLIMELSYSVISRN